ncbi:MAG: hypothetical protein SH818_12315, partial [Saprospiraceae bacterium]|nr:hypothetical protein [Saprospiraceae bacterium]
FSVALLMSCSKDEKTTIEILNAHPWKISSAVISPGITNPANGSVTTDLLALAGSCLADNVYSFTIDSKYIADEGPTKCNPSDPQQTSGTLSLSTDNKSFTANGTVYTFQTVSENKLVYSFSASVNGISQTVTFTMVPK